MIFNILLPPSIIIKDSNNTSIDSGTKMEDIEPAPQEQSVGHAGTKNEAIPGTGTSPRTSILSLPPEIRLMIFRHLLEPPSLIPYYAPRVFAGDNRSAFPSLFQVSRLIREESMDVFYKEGTFYMEHPFGFFGAWFSRITAVQSWRIGDMIQNLFIEIPLAPIPRDELIDIIKTFGDPSIIRGTLTVSFVHPRREYPLRYGQLLFYLRSLGRFTNFRTVKIQIGTIYPWNWSNDAHFDIEQVKNALQFVLGPATPYNLHGLTFSPQRFLNSQPRRQDVDWMFNLDGIRLDGN